MRSLTHRCVSDRRRRTCQIHSASNSPGMTSSHRYSGSANRNVLKSTSGSISTFALGGCDFPRTGSLVPFFVLQRNSSLEFSAVAAFEKSAREAVGIDLPFGYSKVYAALQKISTQPHEVFVVV